MSASTAYGATAAAAGFVAASPGASSSASQAAFPGGQQVMVMVTEVNEKTAGKVMVMK